MSANIIPAYENIIWSCKSSFATHSLNLQIREQFLNYYFCKAFISNRHIGPGEMYLTNGETTLAPENQYSILVEHDVAQSPSTKRIPSGIDSLWDKPTHWTQQLDVRARPLSSRKYDSQHTSLSPNWSSSIATGTYLRGDNSGSFSPIWRGTEHQKLQRVKEMAEQVSNDNEGQNTMRREIIALDEPRKVTLLLLHFGNGIDNTRVLSSKNLHSIVNNFKTVDL